MSSCIRPGCALLTGAVTLAISLAGCVDAHNRFDEFTERVVDAQANRIDGSGALAEINGEFLLTIQPSFDANHFLKFVVTSEITIDGDTGSLDLSVQPLAAERCDEGNGGNEVGDPIVANDLAVDVNGAFELQQDGLMVTMLANDVTCTDIVANLVLNGLIKSEDLYCGDVSGRVTTTGSNLDGSTFGAIRIEPGTRGDANLPESVKACP
jgi:hypothetical protein